MHAWLDWLSSLPAPLLYAAIAAAAFAENIFPPLPADSVVALGAFVCARGSGTAFGAWAATMLGNLTGAMCMFALGRRLGLAWLTRRFPRIFPHEGTQRVAERFRKQGLLAIVISRFLPAVRALVPPVAGAIRFPAARTAIAMSLASGVWYGVVCLLAFRAGANADVLLNAIATQQRTVGIAAVGLVIVIVAVRYWQHRKRGRRLD